MSIKDWFRKKPGAVEQLRPPFELVQFAGHAELEHGFIEVTQQDLETGLEGWQWLGLGSLLPIAVASFGDVFFLAGDGAIVQLDWLEGRLTTVAHSLEEFERSLDSEDVRDNLLLMGLVLGARGCGLMLATRECYDFKIPPILGGAMEVDNVEMLSFAAKLNIAGQIHQQVKDLPPGTKINSFKITD